MAFNMMDHQSARCHTFKRPTRCGMMGCNHMVFGSFHMCLAHTRALAHANNMRHSRFAGFLTARKAPTPKPRRKPKSQLLRHTTLKEGMTRQQLEAALKEIEDQLTLVRALTDPRQHIVPKLEVVSSEGGDQRRMKLQMLAQQQEQLRKLIHTCQSICQRSPSPTSSASPAVSSEQCQKSAFEIPLINPAPSSAVQYRRWNPQQSDFSFDELADYADSSSDTHSESTADVEVDDLFCVNAATNLFSF